MIATTTTGTILGVSGIAIFCLVIALLGFSRTRKVTLWFLGLILSCAFGPFGFGIYICWTLSGVFASDPPTSTPVSTPVEIHHHHHHRTVVHPVVVVAPPVVTSTRPVRHYGHPRSVGELPRAS